MNKTWRVTVERGAKVAGFDVDGWAGVVALAKQLFPRMLPAAQAALAVGMVEQTHPDNRGFSAVGGADWRLGVCAPLHLDAPFRPGDKIDFTASQRE